MTYEITSERTDQVLAAMFTENTGRHFLDSGGAYGRNWERNQGRDVQSFLSAPAVTIDKYGEVTVDAFHWLRDKLEYDPYWDRIFRTWVALDDAASGEQHHWLESMERFAARVQCGDAEASLSDGYLSGTENTYNHDCALSQTLQFTIFSAPQDHWRDAGTHLCLLQVHGGCDVRGGYTDPRVFRLRDDTAVMFDWNNYSLYCTREPERTEPFPGMPEQEQHIIDQVNGDWITYGGSYVRDPWQEAGKDYLYEDDTDERAPFVQCPYCAEPTPMRATVSYE